MLRAFDASSIIHAWDNYPLVQFPPLWKWMAREISAGRFVMPKVAFEEVNARAPDCSHWLRQNHVRRIEVTNAIVQEALRIKGMLGLRGTTTIGPEWGRTIYLSWRRPSWKDLNLCQTRGGKTTFQRFPQRERSLLSVKWRGLTSRALISLR